MILMFHSVLFQSKEGLDNTGISTNADLPEGTLDAMAQAILCQDVVGWRRNARKIIMVITDATVHVAGDGLVRLDWFFFQPFLLSNIHVHVHVFIPH